MNCNVAIHCTLVVRNFVMVGCAEPWFMHAVAIRAIFPRAEAARARAYAASGFADFGDFGVPARRRAGGLSCKSTEPQERLRPSGFHP
jgi:hypothetical protein